MDGQLYNITNKQVTINNTIYTVVRRGWTQRDFKIELRKLGTEPVLKEHGWGFFFHNDDAEWKATHNPPAPEPSCAGAHIGNGDFIDVYGIDGVPWS